MHTFTIATAALSAIASIPAVAAHGFVQQVTTGGQKYAGASPNWFYTPNNLPKQAGWMAYNQDNGFVEPNAYGSGNVSCHKGAKPGNQYIPVKAGDSMDLQWNTWPDSHKGPITAYMARCNGECTSLQDASSLDWFKIDETGLIDPSTNTWAADKLIKNDFTWTHKIPSNLASGNFVLRHEIIALHSAGSENGAQNYPMCFNLKVSGSGNSWPCNEGADCRHGNELYTKKEAGILFNIYSNPTSYPIPGPKIFKSIASSAKRFARSFIA
ncbi:hypothetical protein KC357_g1917 [Hortaea werneckii]|nr:hypothetical protein KC357_g1917 [Hortaea werneckii]